MKTNARIILAASIFWIFIALPSQARGEGGTGAGTEYCVVNNPGSGAVALRGTVAIDIVSNFLFPDVPQEADFTFRLERSGLQGFFRVQVVARLGGLSREAIACQVLNPYESENPNAATALVQEILTFFELPGRRLRITRSSISETDGAQEVPQNTGRGSSLANITIYALK